MFEGPADSDEPRALLFGGLSVWGVCAWVCVCVGGVPLPRVCLFERMVLGKRPPAPCPGQRRLCSGGQPTPCSPGRSPDLGPTVLQPAPSPHPRTLVDRCSEPGFSAQGSAPPACLEGLGHQSGEASVSRRLAGGAGSSGCPGRPWAGGPAGWAPVLALSPGQGLILWRGRRAQAAGHPGQGARHTRHTSTAGLPWWVSAPRD